MEKPKNNNLVVIIAAIAATGGLLFGYDTGVIAGALPLIINEWHIGENAQSWVVSIVLLGAALGAIFSGKLTDRIGRRKVNLVTAVIFTLGSIGTGLAPSVELLIFGRFIIGIAVGIASFSVPLYISEISPAKSRGAMVSLNQLAITIGLVASFLSNYYLPTWKMMFLVGFVPAMILAIGMFFLPETPRWLVSKHREQEAKDILNKINPGDDADKEIAAIKENVNQEGGGSWSEFFAPWLRTPLIIGIGIFFFQQFSGINAVFYFAPTMFKMAGFESYDTSVLAALSLGIINVLFTIASLWLLDRLGRKPLLYIGFSGIIVCLSILALAFYNQEALGASLKWITVGSLLAYIAFFAISLGPLGWLLISEIYPVKIRGLAMSMCSLSHWIFDFIISFTFIRLSNTLGLSGSFLIYGLICVGGLIFSYYIIPETKGFTLEQIEAKWLAKKKS